MLIGLDFETYGSVDLRKHGLDRYVNDPHFKVLIGCATYSVDSGLRRVFYDFVKDPDAAAHRLAHDLGSNTMAAHNAGFEVEVLKHLGIERNFAVIDTAVSSRVAGGGSSLAAASAQLLNEDKMEEGAALIKLFSIPQKDQTSLAFNENLITDHPGEWAAFIRYCHKDAELSFKLAKVFPLLDKEMEYQEVTMVMNQVGWHVDVKTVEEMHRRYLENLERTEHDFHVRYGELNFNSLKQQKEFCAKRGVKASSFDQKHVESMLKKIDKKMDTLVEGEQKWHDYFEVAAMLSAKQVLGGSSLKKLQVILDTVGKDGRLRDQYVHCGAGQSLRTTGRAAQMQNLPRLGSKLIDMRNLMDDSFDADNDTLAENIRQVFTSRSPNGQLIVGDFKSVESRGLAWLAGEHWKLEAYRAGKDLYVELANKFGNTRQFGKVGELSCGYQAGPPAVREFAAKMGMPLSEGEATNLVYSWRDACPKTVGFWQLLDDMLHSIIDTKQSQRFPLADRFTLQLNLISTPLSLLEQHLGVQSIEMRVLDSQNDTFLTRVFHGCYNRGRSIAYYKPSDRKTGELWKATFVDPKTKELKFHQIYGGKLAGILTQSFCRELFFQSLLSVHQWTQRFSNVTLVGQFHDEIVLDWVPLANGRDGLHLPLEKLKASMSDPGLARSFPLEADVKHDYRYIK